MRLMLLFLFVACAGAPEDKTQTESETEASEPEPEDTGCEEGLTFLDVDQDGFGDPNNSFCGTCSRCISDNTDCDDNADDVYPGAPEVCDGIDNDCDEVVDDDDDDATGLDTGWLDADGDGFGQAGAGLSGCELDAADNAEDCDDADADVHPDASETCDDVDNDCDDTTDEGLLLTVYTDADGDGYGDPDDTGTFACESDGLAVDNTDCDDADADSYPGADEVCDEVDNDCDDDVDEDPTDGEHWYRDRDGDGFGDGSPVTACTQPEGYADTGLDCDDADTGIHPDQPDSTCNGNDSDCDGAIDEAADWVTLYADADGDGYGTRSSTISACTDLSGYAYDTGDCDDSDDSISPGAEEGCDTGDEDCDGLTDEGVSKSWYFPDADGDGYAVDTDTGDAVYRCEQPAGYGANGGDCDDNDATRSPSSNESCDTGDEDCDGTVDEGMVSRWWYPDADGDGYAVDTDTGDAVFQCARPANHGAWAGDCDDADPLAYPGGRETCDTGDEDCDGLVDEGQDKRWFYPDADGDGYVAAADTGDATWACQAPDGYGGDTGDCDDDDAAINPGMRERCNGVDDDCDGSLLPDGEVDLDGDGALSCWDCDDDDSDVSPFAAETSDTGDEDCDGTIDEGTTDDADGDGYTIADGDCDDRDRWIGPGIGELCDDIDQDCDGIVDEGTDCCADTGLSATWSTDTGDLDVSADLAAGALTLGGDGDLLLCNGDFTADVELQGEQVRVHGEGATLAPHAADETLTVSTSSASVRVSGLAFEDCSVHGIDADGASNVHLSLVDTTFTACTDGCVVVAGDLVVRESTFDTCYADQEGGGAYVSGDAWVTGSSFADNTITTSSTARGASMYVGGNLLVEDTTFSGDTLSGVSSWYSASSYLYGASAWVGGDLVARGVTGEDARTYGYTGGYGSTNYHYGGSMYVVGDASVAHSHFENNALVAWYYGSGGGVLFGGALYVAGDLEAEQTRFQENYSWAYGSLYTVTSQVHARAGAAHWGGTGTFDGVDLVGNHANTRSGLWSAGAYVLGGAVVGDALELEDSVVAGNYVDDDEVSFNQITSRGGALFVDSLVCDDSDIWSNAATDSTAAAWVVSNATSDACDWGEDALDNENADLYLSSVGISWSVDGVGTFTCDTGGCDTGL